MPVPAVPQRVGLRAISAPMPPPAFQQTIHIPMVYMPSTPSTPSMAPISIARTTSPTQIPAQLSSGGMGYDYVPPNGALLLTFNNQPQGWTPDTCDDAYINVFDLPQLDSLAMPPCPPSSDALFKSPSPGSYTNSSGPSSPHESPYTPTALETLHVTTDAWQAHMSLPMLDVEPPMPVSLEYQPHSWAGEENNVDVLWDDSDEKQPGGALVGQMVQWIRMHTSRPSSEGLSPSHLRLPIPLLSLT